MLQSVEAIIEPTGIVRLLESLQVDHPYRAVVTLLEAPCRQAAASEPTDQDDVLSFLQRTRLARNARLSAGEICEALGWAHPSGLP
jgi:hypothetical protein